MLIVNFC